MSEQKKTGNSKIQHLGGQPRTETTYPYKTFMFFGLVGSTLVFLTLIFLYAFSAYSDATNTIALPKAFTVSTIFLLLSSFVASRCMRAFKSDNMRELNTTLAATLLLALAFCISQIVGWKTLLDNGWEIFSSGSITYVFIISAVHLLHIIAGMSALAYINYTAFEANGNIAKTLLFLSDTINASKIELATVYWHFLNFAWICLFLTFLFSF